MRRISTIIILGVLTILLVCIVKFPTVQVTSFETRVVEAKKYIATNNMNKDIAIFINFSTHSGKKRLVVYDLKKDSVLMTMTVAQGAKGFSNKVNSHQSSLGKYLVADRAYSTYKPNIKYWLEGLEGTNSNARRRVVVLHGWFRMTTSAIYPIPSARGWGCPAVSISNMRKLDKVLRHKRRVLLWAYIN